MSSLLWMRFWWMDEKRQHSSPATARRESRRTQLRLERLEDRTLLTAGFTEFAPGMNGANGVLTGQPAGMNWIPRTGEFWFSEQLQDRVGWFNPVTLTFGEIGVPAHTAPHNAHQGPDGMVYFSSVFDKILESAPAQ